jgi:hypothetical protein
VSEVPTDLLRPKVPTPNEPRGFFELEGYSNIKRFWDLLEGCHKNGFTIRVPHRTEPNQCRRAIEGLTRDRAGGLINDSVLLAQLMEDEDITVESFNLEPEPRQAISALLQGYRVPLVDVLNQSYRLEFDVQLGFTARRQLVMKASATYAPIGDLEPPFPDSFKLEPIRWRRDDYKVLIERAAMGLITPASK